jgi:transposase-like protein
MWFMMAQKTGVSAKNLKDSLGFGSYQTIWGWLHKFRSVMVRPGRDRLQGSVEVDETYIGGESEGKRGRGAGKKVLVAVAVEGENKKLGRVRLRCISDASAESLIPFVSENVEPGSKVVTDGWKAYSSLASVGYAHIPRPRVKAKETGEELLCHVHLVVTLLKRWLRGTHQGAVGNEHLQDYLNEYAFRFNRRLSTYRGKLFHRLMQQAISTRPPSIKEFYHNKHHI